MKAAVLVHNLANVHEAAQGRKGRKEGLAIQEEDRQTQMGKETDVHLWFCGKVLSKASNFSKSVLFICKMGPSSPGCYGSNPFQF